MMDYVPKLDRTNVLTVDLALYYQSLIGIMQWMCEIGRVDIVTEVSMLSSHLALPQEGHFHTTLHIMAYLGQHHSSRIVDYDIFPNSDWAEFYGKVEEAIPPNAPPPRGLEVKV